jgi:2-oxoglutarate/2-oxoacid ferredoxin oxidoreductase subunit beta
VTQAIIKGYFESKVHPFRVAKLSGIGCSSKTPAYFMNQAHGFNSIHGRMAAVATGAKLANRDLHLIGVSGDGDTASIGLGGFLHLLRRNLPMVYIVENNGVYGLTKGQFSATADEGSQQKSGEKNPFIGLDLCSLAIEADCGFVARSFSGDAKQLIPLIKAAIQHNGTAFIDVISPCVTYANHEGSTRSYDYVREHKVSLQELGYISEKSDITADYDAGQTLDVEMANGDHLRLKKISHQEHDVTDAVKALKVLHEARHQQEILTGLFYLNEKKPNLLNSLHMGAKPLNQLQKKDLCPSESQLRELLSSYK